jgi:enamine deaminase RidA (YjgF/YER057c/UK114 family)
MHGLGRSPEDAASQADCAMRNAKELIQEAEGSFADIARIRVYIGDRAYRESVYQVLARHLGDTHPCSTGLIVNGFARPEILFEIDMEVPLGTAGAHARFRRFHTNQQNADGQQLGCKLSMAVRAAERVYLRGQTALTLDGGFAAMGDAAGQAEQAMDNIGVLLGEAGASLADVTKVTVYVTDRAYLPQVHPVVARYLAGVHPAQTSLIVNGLADPRMLVEIDVEAVTTGAGR